MRTSIMLSSATALALVVASSTLYAQRPGGPGRGGPGRGEGPGSVAAAPGPRGGPGRMGGGRVGRGPGFGIAGRHLDLTAEQRTKVQAIVRTARDKSAPVVGELQLAEKTLRREIFAESPDPKRIADLAAKVEDLRKQVGGFRLKTATDIAALLTPAQKEVWRAGGARGARGANGARVPRGPGSRG